MLRQPYWTNITEITTKVKWSWGLMTQIPPKRMLSLNRYCISSFKGIRTCSVVKDSSIFPVAYVRLKLLVQGIINMLYTVCGICAQRFYVWWLNMWRLIDVLKKNFKNFKFLLLLTLYHIYESHFNQGCYLLKVCMQLFSCQILENLLNF